MYTSYTCEKINCACGTTLYWTILKTLLSCKKLLRYDLYSRQPKQSTYITYIPIKAFRKNICNVSLYGFFYHFHKLDLRILMLLRHRHLSQNYTETLRKNYKYMYMIEIRITAETRRKNTFRALSHVFIILHARIITRLTKRPAYIFIN